MSILSFFNILLFLLRKNNTNHGYPKGNNYWALPNHELYLFEGFSNSRHNNENYLQKILENF